MSNDLDLKLRISQDGAEATAEHLGSLKKGVDGIGDAAKESTAALAPLKKGFDEIGDAVLGFCYGFGAGGPTNDDNSYLIGIDPIFTET